MIHFPPEIFKQIITLLHQQDKVECMTVCRQWRDTISVNCLFHTVRICDASSLQQLEELCRQYPHKGAQVQYLALEVPLDGPLDLRNFLCLLPNVKYIYSKSSQETILDTEFRAQPWHGRIEQISLLDENLLTANFMFMKKLSQLKRLSLHGINMLWDELFDTLQNISTLSHLTLFFSATNLSLTHIERLHQKLPLLEYFKLDLVTLAYEPLPPDISPAIHLVQFCLTSIFSSSVEAKIALLCYISKKYPNMIDLETGYNIDDISEEINDHGETLNIIEGYNALFQRAGSHLKRLRLHSSAIPSTIFQIIDRSGCQLEHLQLSNYHHSDWVNSVYSRIQHSEQARYIHTLDLELGPSAYFPWLKDMTALKILTLKSSRIFKSHFEFSELLEFCPDKLESLELHAIKLASTQRFIPHSLKSLYLSSCHFMDGPGFVACISDCLPHLTSLKFGHCIGLPARLMLRKHALSRFEISSRVDTPLYQLQVLTEHKTTTYTSRSKNTDGQDYENDTPSLYPSPLCTPLATAAPNLFLECASVNKVVL